MYIYLEKKQFKMFDTFSPINMAFTKISELLKYNGETSVVNMEKFRAKQFAPKKLHRVNYFD